MISYLKKLFNNFFKSASKTKKTTKNKKTLKKKSLKKIKKKKKTKGGMFDQINDFRVHRNKVNEKVPRA
jgi:Flp pilus assembly protein TadB